MSGENTRNLVAGGPAGGGGGKPSGGKWIGVSDDYTRTSTRQVEDPNNPHRRVAPGVIRGGTLPQTQVTRPQYNQAYVDAQMANMSPEDVWALQQQMARAGFIGKKERFAPGMWDTKTKNAFKDVLELANTYTTDVDTALQMAAQGTLLAGESDGLDAPFTGVKRQRDKTVDLTDPQSARTRIRKVLREELGRSPSKEEYAAFVSALGGAERSNPTVVDSSTTFDQGESTGTDATRSGGIDPGAFTEEYVIEDPGLSAERNAFTRDTDYYQAAMSVLGMGGASG